MGMILSVSMLSVLLIWLSLSICFWRGSSLSGSGDNVLWKSIYFESDSSPLSASPLSLNEICVERITTWLNSISSNPDWVLVVWDRDLSWATRSRNETKSSLRNANDHPSVLFAISSASSVSDLVNLIESVLSVDSSSTDLIFWIHLSAYSVRKDSLGRSKLYLTSKREGRLRIASSIRSGWFVVAIVRIPSFWPYIFVSI